MAENDLAAVDPRPTRNNLTFGFRLQRLTSYRLMRNVKASVKRKLLSD